MVVTSFSSNPSHPYDPSFINSVVATVLERIFPPELLSYKTNEGTMYGHLQDFVMSAFTSGSAQDTSRSHQLPPATTASTVDSPVQTDRNVPQSTVSSPPVPPGHSDPQPPQIKNPYASPSTAQGEVPIDALRRYPVDRDDISTGDFADEAADGRSTVSAVDDTYEVRDTGDTASIASLPGSKRGAAGVQTAPSVQRVPLTQPVQQQTGQPQTAGYDTGSVNDANSPYQMRGEPADVPGQTGYDGSSIESTGRRPRRFPENHDMHGARYPVDPGRFNDAGSNDWGSMFSGWQAEVASLQQSLKSFQDSILLSLNSLDTRFDKLSGQLSEATTALTGFTGLPNQSAAPSNSFQPAALQTADPSAPIRPEESIRQVQFADQQGRPGSEQTVPNSNAPPAMAPQVTPDGMKHGQVGFAPLTGNEVTDTAQAVKGDQSISGGNGTAPRTQRTEGRHFWQRRP